MIDQVRSGQVRSGQVRSGQVRSGQVILYFVEKYPTVFHDGSGSHTRPDG
jgi:hypothetical protein